MTYWFVNFAGFYLGWFACVVGAAHGMTLLGPLAVIALVALHLRVCPDPIRELRLILVVGAAGTLVDTLNLCLGVFAFPGRPEVWLCPPWLTAVWMIFASTLNASLGWLSGRYAAAAFLGGLTGPLSYYAAVRIGVIEFPDPALSLTALATVWAVTMPVLLVLQRWMAATPTPAFSAS